MILNWYCHKVRSIVAGWGENSLWGYSLEKKIRKIRCRNRKRWEVKRNSPDGVTDMKREKRDETCTSLAIPHQLPTNGLLMFDIPNVEKQPQQPLLVNVTICSAVCVHSHPQTPTPISTDGCSTGRSASLPWWFSSNPLKANKSRSQYRSSSHLSCWSKLLL